MFSFINLEGVSFNKILSCNWIKIKLLKDRLKVFFRLKLCLVGVCKVLVMLLVFFVLRKFGLNVLMI